MAAYLHHYRRQVAAVQAQADALLTLATAQEFPLWIGYGTCWRGWALAMQGQGAAGLAQLHQGMMVVMATGHKLAQPHCLVLLAEAAGHAGQVAEGLRSAGRGPDGGGGNTGGATCFRKRIGSRGTLRLRQAAPEAAQAEACFQQALAIARRQQAKSWELRAA